MAGLLDFLQTPEGQGLFAAVAGGMAGARRGAPINSLGIAGMSGLTGYTNAVDKQAEAGRDAAAASFRGLQTKELTAKLDEQLRQRQAIDNMRGNVPEQDRSVFDAAPQEYIKNMPQFHKPSLVEVADPNEPLRTVKKWMKPGDTDGSVAGFGAMPEMLDPRVQAAKAKIAAAGRAPNVPMAPVGYMDDNGKAIWGTITEAKGRPMANFNPSLQAEITGAKTGAKERTEAQVAGEINLPKAISNGEEALKQADALIGSVDGKVKAHPGFAQATGGSSMLGIQKIPGTSARDFMNRLEQVKGGAFLTAFETLKGGGQITEVEGAKATAAVNRMDNATSEEEFKSAVRDYQNVIRTAVNNAKAKAGRRATDKPAASPGGLTPNTDGSYNYTPR